ncbi:Holliday junction resolvase RuvX [Pectinatus cerevisiiphilus]|uniref:Putative pre-16S rRNA nuclease n=1 Tax=Pectinatus cerevisiiphilus TaxID=86956 RepID=A0A4R3K9N5_9FIRM|nr:Holliday junction resolvase RuvX [Pectinatus cerevisiiphilus]TCS79700.1 putative Holliday junction resolvase [Pectinatus cerevisiiphilus]
MRIIGLDVGDKTIGIAVSDALMFTAQGIETIRRESWENDLRRLQELIAEYEIERIVVGLPRNMNGTEGERCDIVREFAKHLKESVTDKEIVFWDERLSTVAAERYLIAADVSRAKRRKVIDKMAAVFILQGYLDSNPHKL